jgi:hypothetical protein
MTLHLPALELQRNIQLLEDRMLTMPQVDFPLLEWIDGSYYYRAIRIPKGSLLTGARHRQEHECVCIGDLAVSTDTGVARLQGYHRLWAAAGKKRVGLAMADTIWLTVHWIPEGQGLEGIEELLTFPAEHKNLVAVRQRRLSRILQSSNVRELQES